MAVLSNRSIFREVAQGRLIIEPFAAKHVQPASYDLTVEIDARWRNGEQWIDVGEFYLFSTIERVVLPADLQGQVLARSSIARKGLIVEWAGFIDPGFDGQITLEVQAMHEPVLLKHGDRIAQIAFHQLDQAAVPAYNGRYQGQRGATGSRFRHGDE